MFSFFKRKPPFTVRVKEYETSKYIAGMKVNTDKGSIKKDVGALQKRFQDNRELLQDRSNPSATLVVCGKPKSNGYFSYFVGDLVDSPAQPDDFTIVELVPGKYAYVTIDFKDPSDLTFAIAKAKQKFFSKWLPSSGYRVKEEIESIELYDRRSNIALASMDLIFPLTEK